MPYCGILLKFFFYCSDKRIEQGEPLLGDIAVGQAVSGIKDIETQISAVG